MKEQIIAHIISLLDEKISVLKTVVEEAKESRNNDTKSSAGDKYETSREIIQQEINKSEHQLQLNRNLKAELLKIDPNKQCKQAGFGSLVNTNHGNYFISIAMGKINIEQADYFCISLASPIGKVFFNKKEKDSFFFMNKEFFVKKVL